jgi:predicted TPR repeat methyltransferase
MSASEQRLKDAIAKHRAGEQLDAEQGYREHLREFPQDPTALHFLGLMRHQQDRTLEGIELMEAAVRADPGYVDAWSNLGIAFFRQRDYERSVGCCRKAIELDPGFINAWSNLGFALRGKGAFEEALTAWERALELQPNLPSVAIPYGRLLYRLNRVDAARAFYEKSFRANPSDPIAAHMLAAMSDGKGQPKRASDEYVRTTFDDFADSFDHQLEGLQYRAPQVLCQAAKAEFAAAGEGTLNVLDLGCGTGLCGPLFGPIARRLVGVDLSSKMLAKAAARGCYQQLNFSELSRYLQACTEQFDVVVAADVLCYFGSLTETFEAVRRVLTPNGRFFFSLEDARNSGSEPREGFLLKPHGRYEHDRTYVESTMKSVGLQIVSVCNETLRLERGEPVIGLIVTGMAGTTCDQS